MDDEYYFELPALDDLTLHQKSAVNNPKQLALTGGPGTGKSVVSLYRHLKLFETKNCQLLTYTKTLTMYLKRCCATKNINAANNVGRTLQWTFSNTDKRDEIIIDEAQDIKIGQHGDNVFEKLKTLSANISFGADEAQSVYNGPKFNELKNIFPNNQDFRLEKNYRNSKCIMRFAFKIFPNADISYNIIDSCKREGNKPFFTVTEKNGYGNKSNLVQDNEVLATIKTWQGSGHNIAILVPWGNEVQYFYDLIKNEYPNATFYYNQSGNEHGHNHIGRIHISTLKSAKGLEFDTVILPNFNKAFEDIERFNITWKDFYVGVTRAKSNLFLISNYDIDKLKDVVTIQVPEN